MKELIVLVDNIEDWKAYYPTEHLMLAKDYLFDLNLGSGRKRPTRVINLCKSYKYLSVGYYSSLLAESRGHRIIPSLKTLNDLSKKKLYLYDLDELQEVAKEAAERFTKKSDDLKAIAFRCYFGHSKEAVFKGLAQQIYEQFPSPILEIKLNLKELWKIDSVTPVAFTELNEDEEEYFGKSLEVYSTKMWRLPNPRRTYIFNLAILTNPEEELPPSDETALQNFEKVCAEMGIYSERVTRKDLSRLNEFDGLFIRETTTIKNHTYAFSHRAQQEGLVVIDDPESILKCTNKVFMYNLMVRNNIPQLPSRFVSDSKDSALENLEKSFDYPMILKIPDGSFSIGVKKVLDRQQLKDVLVEFFKKSALVLVQKFLPTDFDWRIGVLRGEALFACKYFMSKGHWQIYDHTKKGEDFSGDSETLPLNEVPKFIIDTAIKVTGLVGNGLYGVDIKEHNGEALVVEVNDNPNIDHKIEDLVLGEELYRKLALAFIDNKVKVTHTE